jgi:thiol peroxidase
MTVERSNAVTLKGNPFTLVGPELEAGSPAPDFQALSTDLTPVTLADTGNSIRVFSVVPSLDTPVCDQQTRRFNQEASGLGDGVVVLTVSADLPFAQKRWCGAAEADGVQTLSDHQEMSFATSYGTLVKELRLESRAIFVVDAGGRIRYAEYVKEIASHPDYEAALAAAKGAV